MSYYKLYCFSIFFINASMFILEFSELATSLLLLLMSFWFWLYNKLSLAKFYLDFLAENYAIFRIPNFKVIYFSPENINFIIENSLLFINIIRIKLIISFSDINVIISRKYLDKIISQIYISTEQSEYWCIWQVLLFLLCHLYFIFFTNFNEF